MANKLKIGFIGLGAMGLGMASCLVKAGFEVTGFDINEKAITKFVSQGGKASDTPRLSAAAADVLVIMVATTDQATSVIFDDVNGALANLSEEGVILLCITAYPAYAVALESKLKSSNRSDVKLIDCPVSGGEVRAQHGSLSLICAGKEEGIKHIDDMLGCMGSQIHIIPGGIGAASIVKMIHQILVGVHILTTVEVLGLAYIAGLDLHSVYRSVMGGNGASWLFGQRAAHVLQKGEIPASSLMIITKDFAMIERSARNYNYPLPLASLAYQLFILASSASENTDDDCLAINLYLAGRANLSDLRKGPCLSEERVGQIEESVITDLLIGVHTAVAIEALRFAKKQGISLEVVRAVVHDAAGSSAMFSEVCTHLQGKSEVSLETCKGLRSVMKNLASAIEAAQFMKYPLFLASAALNQCTNS